MKQKLLTLVVCLAIINHWQFW